MDLDLEMTEQLQPLKVVNSPYPWGLKFVISFFLADATFRLAAILTSTEISSAAPEGMNAMLSAFLNSRMGLMFSFIIVFDVVLALQLLAKMSSGRLWAVFFSVLQILNLIADPFSVHEVGLVDLVGRIQIILGAAFFGFCMVYCLLPSTKKILNR